MAFYLDSSAVIKYYVTEPGTVWVREKVDGDDAVLLSEITIAEVPAALGILLRMGRISQRHQRDFWERFERDCRRGARPCAPTQASIGKVTEH